MRFLVLLFFPVLLCASQQTPTPTPFDPEKVDYSKFSDEEIAKTEAHRDQLKAEVKNNLNTIVVTSDAQATTLNQTTKSLDVYDAAVKTRIDEGNAAIVALGKLVKKHHLDLIILIGLWTGVVALAYLKAGAMLGAAGIWVGIGVEAAGVAFILWRL